MNLPNIEKSAFRRGEYVGYSDAGVWHIKRSNSSCGNWWAMCIADNQRHQLWGHTLKQLSAKLSTQATN